MNLHQKNSTTSINPFCDCTVEIVASPMIRKIRSQQADRTTTRSRASGGAMWRRIGRDATGPIGTRPEWLREYTLRGCDFL